MSALMKSNLNGLGHGLVVLRDIVADSMTGSEKAVGVSGRSGGSSTAARLRVVSKNSADIVDGE